MPKIAEDTTPKNLRPYIFHGLDLEGNPNAVGECPFCGKEKFSVNVETGLWRCFVCEEKGNVTSFLRKLVELLDGEDERISNLLSRDRRVSALALYEYHAFVHPVTMEYAVAGYSVDRKVSQIYRYVVKGSKKLLLATPTVNHGLFLPFGWDDKKKIVYVCEGPWDAMALWDALRGYKEDRETGELSRTGSEESSLLASANVVGIPGCGSVGEPFLKWCSLFKGKQVVLCFDSDHPRENEGRRVEPAGYSACKRACELMARTSDQPDRVSYLKWGNDGFDPARKSGYDVRDLLTEGDRAEGLAEFLGRVEPIPEDWVKGRSAASRKGGKVQIECLPCESWKELVPYWRKAMKWIDGLDKGLSVCFASIVSTRAVGDQLWIKLVSPPSTGKTTLVEALAVAKDYVYSTDTMTGLVSGYQVDKEGSENMSMVLRLKDKTLVIKDADTILSDPNLQKILSQFRAFYDRALRTQYGNKMSAAHEGINTTVILCGTNSLRKLDSSELGERFLDCVIMDKIDVELEHEVLYRKLHQAKNDLSQESNGQPSSQVSPVMLAAMQRTGGYVTYLRQNANQLLAAVDYPEKAVPRIIDYGKFIAFMRARPSSRQDETAEREFAARLVSQITRLAGCLAVVLNRKSVDEEVLARTKGVVMDTARGRTLEIAAALYREGRIGLTMGSLEAEVHASEEGRITKLVKFLRQIGAVESFEAKNKTGVRYTRRYRLTEQVQGLYGRVVGDA